MIKNLMPRYYLILVFYSLPFQLAAIDAKQLPSINPVPGGIAIVKIAKASSSRPQVYFEDTPVMVIADDSWWKAIVGIPLTVSTGENSLDVTNSSGAKQQIEFTVKDKKYRKQYIKLKNKRQVDPSADDMKRINRETALIKNAFRQWTKIGNPPMRFSLPVTGRMSSEFGLRRFFNDQPRKPHSGLDIAAPKGTIVRSPAAGEIILVGNYFFNGKSIFIDHGQGLISMLNHLNKIYVKQGMHVKVNDKIGEVGRTGRATGPHLHWSVSLNNARVDPLLLIDKKLLNRN